MLFGNKKKNQEERDWCVILNSIQSEFEKRKIAQKISEIFSLSTDEAFDLVASTPIILLDHLSHPIAAKVKAYFSSVGAPVVLSKDVFFKRKCYRTVWPHPPSLGFLSDWAAPAEASSQSEEPTEDSVLSPDEAVCEIRSLNEPIPDVEVQEIPRIAADAVGSGETKEKMPEDKIADYSVFQRPSASETSYQEPSPSTESEAVEENVGCPSESGRDSQKEIEASLKNRYESIKEEYRLARDIFQEKWTQNAEAIDGVMKIVETLQSSFQEFQEGFQQWEEKMTDFKKESSQGTTDRQSWEDRMGILSSKMDQLDKTIEAIEAWKQEFSEYMQDILSRIQTIEKAVAKFETFEERAESFWAEYARQIGQIQKEQEKDRQWMGSLDQRIEEAFQKIASSPQSPVMDESVPDPEPIEAESEMPLSSERKQALFDELREMRKVQTKSLQILETLAAGTGGGRSAPSGLSIRRPDEEILPVGVAAQEKGRSFEGGRRLGDRKQALEHLVQAQERIEREIREREKAMAKIIEEQVELERVLLKHSSSI